MGYVKVLVHCLKKAAYLVHCRILLSICSPHVIMSINDKISERLI